jgi:hypothetical protein
MAPQRAISTAKSVHELTTQARSLLNQLADGSQNVLRLTGAPLELISRELAAYEPAQRGYELKITPLGMTILRSHHTPTTRTVRPFTAPTNNGGRLIRPAGY